MDSLYEITVPAGVSAGQYFQIQIAGALMSVQCPQGVSEGSIIQVWVDRADTVCFMLTYTPPAPCPGRCAHRCPADSAGRAGRAWDGGREGDAGDDWTERNCPARAAR